MIHATAIVDPKAELDSSVTVGPYSIIGADVQIGAGTVIGPHAVIKGPTTLGKNNKVFQFATLGEDCQDLKYAGEPTRLEVGDNNVFRESTTIHRGTVQDNGITKIGDNNLIMINVHIAHDCVVANNCIFSVGATIAGHVHIGDHAILGGLCAIHQFCHIGAHSFIGGGAIILRDLPPYVMLGNDGKPHGINSEGLRRRGYSSEAIMAIKRAYKVIYRQGNKSTEAVEIMREMAKDIPEITVMADFVANSPRGLIR
ncbi:MAG: acyl-ACP--UDP-N-acetylglucosamine O-acyltransferase [Alteromonadaceae bacterium]|nr:acyl-ACP--UDP-N-acetylglucosamine O-acyltransferase [Alteromonadaceae bacterium]